MKVELQHITKRFPNRNSKIKDEITAVSDFSYEIPDGKLICLLGPSGCGKSTLLYMICGLESPTEGRIFYGDTDVTNIQPENRGVGLVFQNYALYPHLTVRQNIMFPLENFKGKDKLTKAEILRRTEEAAGLVQLSELLDRKPNELSGGQQQRVAIARALVKAPKVLLLDEPLSNLDARLRLQTREEIRRIQTETGVTTIFVTHDQEEAMSISDEIIVMKAGVFQQGGAPQHVYDDPSNLFVAKFLGTPQINVFQGKIENGKLMVGDDVLYSVNSPDRDVTVGIRPEGFLVSEDGPLHCTFVRKEVMGRDITLITSNPSCEAPVIRSVIPADTAVPECGEIAFRLQKKKVLVFDRASEKRIILDLQKNI